MTAEATVRALTDLFFKRSMPAAPREATARAHPDRSLATKAFQKFVSCLSGRESPLIMDLGPIVGANVAFFGERLGCKMLVEDIFKDFDQRAEDEPDEFSAFLRTRFPQPPASLDGILCWDLFDYLDRPTARLAAMHFSRMLKPGGAILALFGTAANPDRQYTKYVVVDEVTLDRRPYPAGRARKGVWLNRDILRMFEGLTVAESILLKHNMREMLLRKSGQAQP